MSSWTSNSFPEWTTTLIAIFFSLKKNPETHNFSWKCFILRNCHSSLKHQLKNSQPGVCIQHTNIRVSFSSGFIDGILFFLFLLRTWYFLCHALCCFWIWFWGGTEQKEKATRRRADGESFGVGRTLLFVTNQMDSKWTFWIWKEKIALRKAKCCERREKVLGIRALGSLWRWALAASCLSSLWCKSNSQISNTGDCFLLIGMINKFFRVLKIDCFHISFHKHWKRTAQR